MLTERWQEIESLYHSAYERKPEERRSFLEGATDNEELRREVESLLANEASAADFLETHSPESPVAGLPGSISAGTEIGPYLISRLSIFSRQRKTMVAILPLGDSSTDTRRWVLISSGAAAAALALSQRVVWISFTGDI